jgi:hypothetical protein
MRTHAEKHGDGGSLVIRIINALPDSNFLREEKVCRESYGFRLINSDGLALATSGS